MALGGALSLADRRLRFGVAARAKAAGGSLAAGGAMIMRPLRFAAAYRARACAAPALAVQPDEVMKDPALEARARALVGAIALHGLPEPVDRRFRRAARARHPHPHSRAASAKGESNDAVRAFLVSRYGDFILLKPPFKLETWLLWLSAPLTLCAGLAAALLARRRAPHATPPLSADEEARLAALTNGDAAGG